MAGLRIPTLVGKMRAPGAKLYRGGGYTYVPTLQQARRRRTENSFEMVKRNPLLFSRVWRMATRMGALPLEVFEPDVPADTSPSQFRAAIAANMGRTGFRIGEFTADAGRKPAPDHPAQSILSMPNENMTRSLLMVGSLITLYTYEKVAWVKERGADGKPVALWPIPGHALQVKGSETESIDHFEVVYGSTVAARYEPEDVCYFRLAPDITDWAGGVGPLTALGKVADFGMSAIDALAEIFDYGITQRIWVDLHGKTLEEDDGAASARIAAQVGKVRSNKGEVPIMEDEATLENLGDPATDNVMSRSLDVANALIDDAFGLKNADDLAYFYGEAIQPIADVFELELERSFFSEWKSKPAWAEFGFRETMKGTPAQRIELHQKAIYSGQETMDEARFDEGRPPLPEKRGEMPVLPLNVGPIPSPAEMEAKAKDTKMGLGGQEGKGTLVALPGGANAGGGRNVPGQGDPTPNTPVGGTAGTPKVSARTSRVGHNWGIVRNRILDAQSEAFGRRAKGLIKGEARKLRTQLAPPLRAAGAGTVGLPPLAELVAALGANDPEFRRFLIGFMTQAGENAWREAEILMDATRQEINQALAIAYAERANAVADRFMLARTEQLRTLFEQAFEFGWTSNRLAEEIAARWGELATHFVDGVSRTEIAWAVERAALGAWHAAGITTVEFVFGGGPCTTGLCEDAALGGPYPLGAEFQAVGASFDGAEAPPLHPSCRCFLSPAGESFGATELADVGA